MNVLKCCVLGCQIQTDNMNGTLVYFLGPPPFFLTQFLVDNLMQTLCGEEEEIRRDTGSSEREGRMPTVGVAVTTL